LVGQDAVNWLLTWRNVHFAFITDVSRPPANIAPITGPVTTTSRIPRLNANNSIEEVSPLNRNPANSVSRPGPPGPPPGPQGLNGSFHKSAVLGRMYYLCRSRDVNAISTSWLMDVALFPISRVRPVRLSRK
jgi:hypothetical protein